MHILRYLKDFSANANLDLRLHGGICISLLFAATLAGGCGNRPLIDRLKPESVVLSFGNSLTYGTGAPRSKSYPEVLGGILACRVINAGLPGEETSAGRERLPALLRRTKPDLLVLCHGANDMLRGRDEKLIIDNLAAMISMAREAEVDVILLGVPRIGLGLRTPAFYRELAKEYDIPLQQDVLAEVLTSPSLKSDAIHPNAAGYERIAAAIAELIRESQAGADANFPAI